PTKYPQAYYVLCTLAYEENKFEKAADYYGKAILYNPDFEQAYYELAGMQINLNQFEPALQTLEKARQKFPRSFRAEFFTAFTYNKLKNYSAALPHYTAAENIARATDPKRLDTRFYSQLGAAHERHQNFAEAEKYFQKALELSPNDGESLNYLGYMWAERGVHLEKARELIEKAVALEPKNAAYLDSLGWVYFKLDDPEKALHYLLQANELAPGPDPSLLDHLGDVYFSLKKIEQARQAWQKSLSLEPNEEIKKKLKK
ncbi:MAG: tetratricopeptide repeat protein, partial [Limisphaerales bacterium]